MKRHLAAAAAALCTLLGAPAQAQPAKPYIILVHGAFADASSWNRVIPILQRDGYFVIAVANPLRGVKSDADYVGSLLDRLDRKVILVGHSYGGSVISEAATGRPKVKGLVYVSAFAPETGETAAALTGKFPGGTLGAALAPPVPLPGGGQDLYIVQDRFPAQFAADVPLAEARLMAADQRPITAAALNEPATQPAWKGLPSWSIYGDRDQNIPPKALAFMARRAHARQTVVVPGGSHVLMVSHPAAVAHLIEAAARAN